MEMRKRRPDWQEADRFIIHVYRDAKVFCDNPAPQDTLSAKFSLQHAVAITLLRGEPSLADFDESAREATDVSELRRKVSVVEDAALTSAYPARFGARLEAVYANGVEEVSIPDALGDPENPVTDELLIAKARMLFDAGGLAPPMAEKLTDAALALSSGGDLGAYAKLLFTEALR